MRCKRTILRRLTRDEYSNTLRDLLGIELDIAETLAGKVFSYALWRNLEFSDRQALGELTQSFRKSGYRLRALISEVVLSETFLTKARDPAVRVPLSAIPTPAIPNSYHAAWSIFTNSFSVAPRRMN